MRFVRVALLWTLVAFLWLYTTLGLTRSCIIVVGLGALWGLFYAYWVNVLRDDWEDERYE